jgi:hypothetical protein
MINYHHKKFRTVSTAANGEVSDATLFYYEQSDNVVTGRYSGGNIVAGHLMALADAAGKLDMRYHHINTEGRIMTGRCTSVPEILPNGKMRLHEQWQWTSGDKSSGESVIEEI